MLIMAEDFNSDMVNILIPIAGAGSRFTKAGFTVPKPLIESHGKTMVEWALQSFNFLDKIKNYRLIFVVLEEHIKQYQLDEKLKKLFGPQTIVITQYGLMNGQTKSSLLAKEYINNNNKLFIYNCDTYATAPVWESIEKEDPDGLLVCFESTDPRYSFAKNDQYGYVSEVAEKVAISNLASTGMYYFKRGSDFVTAAEQLIARGEMYNNEFYVMPCYTELLKAGKKIKTVLTESLWVLGTPEELKNFEENYRE